MQEYVRPEFHNQQYFDAQGQVIEYGDRWQDEPPPEESYSAEHHLERFQPLHDIAETLITYLVSNFDLTVTDEIHEREIPNYQPEMLSNTGSLSGLSSLPPLTETVRKVTLTPKSPLAATIAFTFRPNYRLTVQYGLLHSFSYPVCSCDACDEVWENWADALEDQVFAVVNGQFRELIDTPEPGHLQHSFGFNSEGSYNVLLNPPPGFMDRFHNAREHLERISGTWQAWEFRLETGSGGGLFHSS